MIIVEQNKTAPNIQPTFFGKVVMSDGMTYCHKIEYWKKIVPRHNLHPYRHGPDSYYCNLLRIKLKNISEPPLYIAMSQNELCDDLLPPMPVFYDNRRKREKFAVCIQKGIYGVPAETLISFVELNKALGASFITTRIIKNILKNERVCRDIYQNRKSTGTRWLWQQNEIPLPHNNRT